MINQSSWCTSIPCFSIQWVEVRTLSGMAWDGEGFICRIYTCICFMGNKTVPSKSPLSGVDCKCMLVKPWTQFLILTAVMLWGNLSYPNSNNWKKNSKLFPCFDHMLTYFSYTPFILWSVETYIYIWTSGIYFVSQSSQLYKIRELPSKIKLSILWVEIFFYQQQKKRTPNICPWPDFPFKLFIVQSYSR